MIVCTITPTTTITGFTTIQVKRAAYGVGPVIAEQILYTVDMIAPPVDRVVATAHHLAEAAAQAGEPGIEGQTTREEVRYTVVAQGDSSAISTGLTNRGCTVAATHKSNRTLIDDVLKAANTLRTNATPPTTVVSGELTTLTNACTALVAAGLLPA